MSTLPSSFLVNWMSTTSEVGGALLFTVVVVVSVARSLPGVALPELPYIIVGRSMATGQKSWNY